MRAVPNGLSIHERPRTPMPFDASRRRFLATVSVSAAALLLPACRASSGEAPAGEVPHDASLFPQSLASGDPRPDRVLLWTRVVATAPSLPLVLQVSEREDFADVRVQRRIDALAAHDHCVRVRLTDLQPRQTLYYRFLVDTADGWRRSPVGRTRTAPAADADVPVRYASMSCQDYSGRWYNTLLPLLDEDLDFVLHLGDFVYETTGDPSFQSRDGERRIVFDDAAGAITLGSDDAPYFAARSLDNYRQLHRTVRTDATLQRLLERTPLVAIWDDHEFADDSWQASATHHDGRSDEHDIERRRNAEQAYLDYMPIDPDGAGEHVPRDALFPQLRIWRRLRFGRHVDLFLTDTRSERPDHLIPEDAFPGEVLFTRAQLEEKLPALGLDAAAVEPLLLPCLDLEAHPALKPALNALLQAAYMREGLDAADAAARAQTHGSGLIAYLVLRTLLEQWNAAAPEPMRAVIPPPEAANERGFAWVCLGKTQLFASVGARYFVVDAAYALLAAWRSLDSLPRPMSAAQHDWLAAGLRDSDARWKTIASSISLTPIRLDLSDPALDAPPLMRRTFLLNVDHWDGFPTARRALLQDVVEPAGGAIVLSGDIHAAFVSQHGARTVEFTAPGVSSKPLRDILAGEVERDPATAAAGRRMVKSLDAMIRSGADVTRHVDTGRHGVYLIEADATRLQADLLTLPADACRTSHYAAPAALASSWTRQRFVVGDDGRVYAEPA